VQRVEWLAGQQKRQTVPTLFLALLLLLVVVAAQEQAGVDQHRQVVQAVAQMEMQLIAVGQEILLQPPHHKEVMVVAFLR